MKLIQVKYKLRKRVQPKSEIYEANILAYGENEIRHFLEKRYGNRAEIMDWTVLYECHAIDYGIIDDLLDLNADELANKVWIKEDENNKQKRHYEKLLQEKKKEWYEVDEIINDGQEKAKESSVWSSNQY